LPESFSEITRHALSISAARYELFIAWLLFFLRTLTFTIARRTIV